MSNGIGIMHGDGDKPDPEAFKVHMRTVHAGDDTGLRHDDFVGSYDHTGRVKLEKKKWTPKKPDTTDNAFRVDDWMGSGAKPQRRSWQVKSTTNVGGNSNGGDDHKSDEFVTSPTATRKWVPPPKNQGIPPPWMSSPTGSTTRSPRASWHPPSKPFHASDHTKDSSVQSDLSFSDLHIPSTHSHVKDAIERLSGSMTHVSLETTKSSDHHRGWQSHSALNHNPKTHDSHNDSSKGTSLSHEHEEGSHSAYEVESDDEGANHHPVPKETTTSPVEPRESSPGAVKPIVDVHDNDKPDPEQYKVHIRNSGEGSMMRHDDFVGSYNHTGRTKLEPKKWTPVSKTETGDNVFKSDEWMGSGKTQRRSWQVKSPTKVGTLVPERKSEEFVSPKSAVAHKWTPPSKDHVASPPWMPASPRNDHNNTPSTVTSSEVVSSKPTETVNHEEMISPPTPEKERSSVSSSAAPSIVPAVGYVVGDDDGRPNPEEFKIHMRTVHAGDDTAMRHDDFVGSYSHTGRTKLEKKWKPASKPEVGDNAFRSDDWMGSGKTQQRTWQVKSPNHGIKLAQDDKPADFVNPSHSAKEKWNPASNDHPVSPPKHSTSVHAEPDGFTLHQENHTVKSEVILAKTTEAAHQEASSDTSTHNKHETISAPSRQSDSMAQASSPVAAPASVPSVGYVVDDDDGRPNPEEFKIHMRSVHAGDDTAMRHDDFVGSYSHTGRSKLEKKKWTPASKPETGDNAFRSDEWMGSSAPKKRSWKVKN